MIYQDSDTHPLSPVPERRKLVSSVHRERDVKKISDGVVRYNCDQKTKDILYDKILEWFMDREIFNNESIVQSDISLLDGPDLLSEIAEDIFEFDAIFVDEEE